MAQTKFTTSFIPKKPIQTSAKGGKLNKKGMGIFSLLTVVIFIATIVAAGGVFFYEITLSATKESQVANLQKVSKSFDTEFISQATRLNDRLLGVKGLLNDHTSPSQIFSLFEEYTLKTVRFSNLNYSLVDDGTIRVSASGVASGFQSIVLQSDEYGKSGFLRDVIFSGLQPNESGTINFSFESTLDPQLILYRNSLVPINESAKNTTDIFDDNQIQS